MKNLNDKLAAIQGNLNAPKSQRNDFGNSGSGYNYRSCEDIVEAVKPLLNGLTLIISDEMEQLGDRYYVKATAGITDGEHKITSTAYAREPEIKKGMDAAQITGATSSYARKYALNGLFAIDDTKDADTQDNSVKKVGHKSQNLSEGLLESVKAISNALPDDLSAAHEAWSELTDEEKKTLWVAPSKGGHFTTEERKIMQSEEFRTANS